MDLSSVLSLLATNKANGDLSSLLSLLANKGDGNSDKLLSMLLDKTIKSKQERKPKMQIYGFVNDDILGKITRYMAKYSAQKRKKP